MRSLLVVVSDELPQGPLKVTVAQDEDMVQTLSSYGSDEAFSDGVRFRRAYRRSDDPHSFRAKHLVERPRVLGVAVPDRKWVLARRSSIARLRACWATQAEQGWAVTPARCTFRVDNSMKKST